MKKQNNKFYLKIFELQCKCMNYGMGVDWVVLSEKMFNKLKKLDDAFWWACVLMKGFYNNAPDNVYHFSHMRPVRDTLVFVVKNTKNLEEQIIKIVHSFEPTGSYVFIGNDLYKKLNKKLSSRNRLIKDNFINILPIDKNYLDEWNKREIEYLKKHPINFKEILK